MKFENKFLFICGVCVFVISIIFLFVTTFILEEYDYIPILLIPLTLGFWIIELTLGFWIIELNIGKEQPCSGDSTEVKNG